MQKMGFDPKEVLRNTLVSEKTLQDRFSLIQISDYIRIVSNMMEMSQDPTLAFKLAGYIQTGDLGVLASAMSASPNFKEGMDLWRRYNRLFFGDLILIRPFRQSGMQYFEYVPQVPMRSDLLQFFMEEKIVAETALLAKLNIAAPVAQYFSVTYPRPAHGDLYEEFFKQGLEFGADRILYGTDPADPRYLVEFESANQELLDVCLEHLEKITNIANSQETLSPQVRLLLMGSLPEIPLLANLAESFNMSKRTFCRNLDAEHTSYKLLLAEVREELAKNYLLTTTMSADKIALRLGFEDTGSLRRAFKQWTGNTMKQFRENYPG